MKPNEELVDEHLIISRSVSDLASMAKALEKGAIVPAKLLKTELAFIENFVHRCHHRKEEQVLFPVLESLFSLRPHDQVPELLIEHEMSRDILKILVVAVNKYANGDHSQVVKISRSAEAYKTLLIEHMKKENSGVLKMIETDLAADRKLEIMERFSLIEEQLGLNHHNNYVDLANTLHDQSKRLAA